MRDFKEEIDKSLDLLFKTGGKPIKKEHVQKNQLIDKPQIVYLQIMLFQIPFGAPRKRKFVRLIHSLYDDPEICLFVPNRKTGVPYKKTTDELIDFCVDYYTEFLEKHKVKGIHTIMPLKQLKCEYGTYELKRKLVRRFDLFLCKNSLLYDSKFVTSLGKIFKVANKIPIGVPFPKYDADYDPEFQKNIEKAIFTSSFYVSKFSDNYSIPVGHITNTKQELKENLETVLQQLFSNDMIPGGLRNVKGINLWPSQSKSIPLFINTEFPVGMKTPRDKCKRKRTRGVKGELSSHLNKKVCVMPNGDVFVDRINSDRTSEDEEEVRESEDDDESFKDESDVDDEEVQKENLKAKMKVAGDEAEEEEEESETDDEEIEKKERRLLREKRLAEEESDTDVKQQRNKKAKMNRNLNKLQETKPKRNSGESDGDEEEEDEEGEEDEEDEEEEKEKVMKKKKPAKAKNKGKVKNANRKMLMKQEKFNGKEKINRKAKSKKKKV